MAGATRRVETYVKSYIGFMSEATPFSALPMSDLDVPPASMNYAITDRTKQYFSLADAVTVSIGGTPAAASAYTIQRLGGIARFSAAQTASTAAPAHASSTLATTTTTGFLVPGTYYVWFTGVNASGAQTLPASLGSQVVPAGTNTNVIKLATTAITPPASGTLNYYISLFNDVTTARLALTGGAGAITGTADTIVQYPTTSAALAPTIDQITAATVAGKYIPMYFLNGGRAYSNTDQSTEIDTTTSGANYMSGVAGRAKVGGQFTFIPGAKITDATGNVVSIDTKIYREKHMLGNQMVIATIDDTTDPLNPRDVFYISLGNYNKTRAVNAAVERTVTWYLLETLDGSDPLANIDFIA